MYHGAANIAKNLYNTDEFKDTIYITSSEKIKSFTGNKKNFLGKGGVIVAKTAKPSQDQRFDIPGFGTKTMESMIHAGATGIVIEAGNTLVVDREKTIAMADAHNITILVK